jgi:multiple sugar transport system permease protein
MNPILHKYIPPPAVIKLFFFVGIVWAAIVGPFSSVLILKGMGASSPQIGVFTALAAVISMVFQPVWGLVSDKNGSPRKVLCLCLSASAVFFGCVLLTANGASVHVLIEGSGPDVLLLHGWGCSVKTVASLTRALAPAYRVIVPDFPGHGESGIPPAPWDVTDYAQMVREVLDQIGVQKCHVIGHSFGGRVGIVLTATWPERFEKFVMTGGAGLILPPTLKKRLRRLSYRAAKALIGLYARFAPAKGAALRRRLSAKYNSPDYSALSDEMKRTFSRVVAQDLRPLLKQIHAPTLLIWGENDAETPMSYARIFEREIPDAHLIVYADCGHYAFLDKPVGGQFVWFSNFVNLFQNPSYQKALANTTVFMGISVPLSIICSLGIAMLISGMVKHKQLFSLIFLIPLVIPSGSMVFFWKMMFAHDGFVNGLIVQIGLNPIRFWETNWAMVAVILIFIWKNLGYNIVLIIAGMSSIPRAYYEAAMVDGASKWQIFTRITLPFLAPTFVLTTLLSIINSFKVFKEVYLITGNYPHDSIYMLQHFMNNMFSSLNYARLTTATTVLILAITLITLGLFRLERKVAE